MEEEMKESGRDFECVLFYFLGISFGYFDESFGFDNRNGYFCVCLIKKNQ